MTRDRIDADKLTRWYDAQARFYSLWRDDESGAHLEGVIELLDRDAELSILDAGCGTGLFSVGLAAAASDWRLTGVDASRGMLDVASERAAKQGLDNVAFRQASVYELPFADGSFDAVVAGGLLPNLDDPQRGLRELHRVLAPGGRLIVVEVDRDGLGVAGRLFFRTMIFGYRVISMLLPRYRFARGWSLERTTLDAEAVRAQLAASGFDAIERVDTGKHWVLHGVSLPAAPPAGPS